MVQTALLLTTVLLAICSFATASVSIRHSPITLSLARKTNFTSSHNLVKADQARARALRARAEAKASGKSSLYNDAIIDEPVTNQAVTYTASVNVGNPPTTCMLFLSSHICFELLIDTGSSNTWVKAERYVHTNTSRQTINSVSVTYGSGSFSGTEFIDLVDLGTGLNISQQSIGVANKSSGFRDIDGILGIGPAGLTVGTLRPNALRSIPTVTDNLFAAGTISQNLIGISYNPTIVEDAVNGELSWGGIDSSKLNGSVSFTPITSTFPASRYWGVNQSIRYGSSTPILSATAGIVDTGTTLILLASDALDNYRNVTGAVYDDKTGLLRITPAQFANLQSLFFTINGVSYELTPNAQIWPRVFNTEIGGTQSDIYLIVSDIGSPSGTGLDFINGYAFLQRYYTVYDTTNSRVGFATTPHTFATSN